MPKQSAPAEYFSDVDLAGRYRVSRATIWRWVHAGFLPKPIKLSLGITRWRMTDVLKADAQKTSTHPQAGV